MLGRVLLSRKCLLGSPKLSLTVPRAALGCASSPLAVNRWRARSSTYVHVPTCEILGSIPLVDFYWTKRTVGNE